jgi:hypothetical protein
VSVAELVRELWRIAGLIELARMFLAQGRSGDAINIDMARGAIHEACERTVRLLGRLTDGGTSSKG